MTEQKRKLGDSMSMKSMPQKPFPLLATIDGETLMTTPLPQARFVVDTLLSQGLHILAGAPKSGKSWLALWLSVMIAKGEDVWGMPVKQGTTLYLCLEDSTIRIQNRLFEITEDAPPSVHFATEAAIIGKVIRLAARPCAGYLHLANGQSHCQNRRRRVGFGKQPLPEYRSNANSFVGTEKPAHIPR
jgi:hypothetical protein